jgi:glyoxylase-like metal-dependent hydrolase (beta-lactamase superfamily II)
MTINRDGQRLDVSSSSHAGTNGDATAVQAGDALDRVACRPMPTFSLRQRLAVGGLVAAASMPGCHATSPAGASATPATLPVVDAIDGILAALDSTPIVAISDAHEIQQLGEFRLRLMRDPRLPAHVQDIVIEGGNSLYQALADRFVNGAPVPDDSLRLIWNNTTQSPMNTLDVPMYAEDVLRTVRAVNTGRRSSERLRVLLADPAIEWNEIRTREDAMAKLGLRQDSQLRVLRDSVLSHGRRALFFCGGVHLYKRRRGLRESLVQRLLASAPGSVFTVQIYDGFGGATASYNRMLDALPSGSMISLADTPLADLSAEQVFAATPEVAAGTANALIQTGAPTGLTQRAFTDLRLGDVTDALLFLGPYTRLSLAPATLDFYRAHPAALAELDRRQTIMTGTHLDTADFFAPPRTSLPFAGGRPNRNIPVPVGRDPKSQAVRALSHALAALGGEARLDRLRTVYRTGARLMSDPLQGSRPIALTDSAPPVIERSSRSVYLDFRGGRSSTVTTGEIFGGQPFAIRSVATPQGGFVANELKHTIQITRTPPGAEPGNRLIALPPIYPEVFIKQLWARRDSLQLVEGPAALNGRQVVVLGLAGVRANGPAGTRYYFDAASGLPLLHETIGRSPNGVDTTVIEYGDWRTVAGVPFPFNHVQRRNGVIVERFEVKALTVNTTLPETVFATPTDFTTPLSPSPLAPKLRKLADDVYMVERTYNSLFVVFDEYVLLVEPVNGTPASQATQQLIAQTAPGKPIRYVVATHFHADHIGGALPFLAGGSILVTTPHAEESIRRLLARTQSDTIHIAASQFERVTSRRTFSDARHTVEVYSIGPNPHAEQMLIVYLPNEQILLEGDLLDIDAAPGRPAIAGRDTDELRRHVRALGLNVATILPVHGRLGTPADLETATKRPPP